LRKVLLLAALCMALALVLSAPVMAQSASADPCPDPDFPRETPDGCQASDLPDVSFGDDASAAASASATASATASASASASVSAPLPETGGPAVSVVALGSLALLVGSGILTFGIIRRN